MLVESQCSIPKTNGDPLTLKLGNGQSVVIIGANGSGKTRLGVLIESQCVARGVQRIAAQKSLTIRDDLSLVASDRATKLLRYGHADGSESTKATHRWGARPATHFLSDFDALLQTLFAKHNRAASDHLQQRKITPDIPAPTTELERLKAIWDGLLPHRLLRILESTIRVEAALPSNLVGYPGSEMSDGERAIIYFLGQCLVAPDGAVIIIDEPESHIHKAILGPLWNTIEKARQDCCFIYITHDLEFAGTHTANAKYFVRSYSHSPPRWEIEEVPDDTGLPEEIVVELVGSRKPILFVEGNRGSLDLTVYQSLYPSFTILPIGTCEAVIHSVASYKQSAVLHTLGVHGLVDADNREPSDIRILEDQGVYALPVAEVENLLLLPSVFLALAEALLCTDPPKLLIELASAVMREASRNIDLVSARYTIRQLDRRLKCVGITARDLATLESSYNVQITSIDPRTVFTIFKGRLDQSIQAANLQEVLRLYDNKGLLSFAASLLGLRDKRELLSKVGRLLGDARGKTVREKLKEVLPDVPV